MKEYKLPERLILGSYKIAAINTKYKGGTPREIIAYFLPDDNEVFVWRRGDGHSMGRAESAEDATALMVNAVLLGEAEYELQEEK